MHSMAAAAETERVSAAVNVNVRDFVHISEALRSLSLPMSLLRRFEKEKVRDCDLALLSESDLLHLVPVLGERVRFGRWWRRNAWKWSSEGMADVGNNAQFTGVSAMFGAIGVSETEARSLVKRFVSFGVTDALVGELSERDLETLIPCMAIRLRFRRQMRKGGQQAMSNGAVKSNVVSASSTNFLF